MKKSIFLFFAAILCAMTANAQWALMGTLTDWSSGKAMTVSGTTATCTVDLAGATQYELKVKYSGTWYGRNTTTISNTTTTSAFNTSGGNVILKTTIPGSYTFSFDTNTKKLTVTYPEVPAPHDITVRAQVPASWTNTITAWVWTSENASGTPVTAEKDGDYYKVTKNAGALYVIFRNGEDWSTDKNQTVDLVYTEDVCLQLNQSGTAKATATVIDCGAVSKDITVKAVVPGAWEDEITAWVWPTGGDGEEVIPTKEGNWYVITKNCIELNVIFKNGTGWNGNDNQTANIEGVSENTCYKISALTKDGEGKCTYTVVDCEAAIEPEAKPVDVYTIVGAETLVGTNWDFNNTDNDMTKQGDGSYVLVKENVELATTGTYEYKVVKNRSWDWKGVNEGNNLTLTGVDVDGTYNVTFTLNKELNALTTSLELVEAKKVIPECYVAGDESLTGQNWNGKSIQMIYDEVTEVYTATLTAVPAGTHNMKVVYGGEWLGFDHLATPAPANVKEGEDKKIQFTLAEAGDVTVTYHATNGIGLTGNFAAPVTYDYYIAGTLAGGWSATQQGMIKDGDLYKAIFSELPANTYQFKITDGQWNTDDDKTHEYTTLGAKYKEVSNVEGNVQIDTEEAKNITVIFDPATGKITFEGLTEIEDYYTVVGVAELFGEAWATASETNKMVKQVDGSYKLVKENVTLAAIGYDWKIAKNGDWWNDAAIGVNPAEGNNTLTITTAGRYNVTFTLAADLTSATVETELLEAAVVIPDCFISGNATLTGGEGWQGNEFTMVYDEETETWSYTLAGLQPEKAYELKVVCGGTWYSYADLASVPTGVTEGNDHSIAFKMAEAGDVTVTYNVAAGITISGNFYVAPTYDYYIAGNMNGWDKAHVDYGMTDENADGIYEKEITLAAGQDHQFKVTNGKWGNEEGGFDCATVEGAYEEVESKDGNVLVKLNAETTFTVKFDKNAKKISFEGLTKVEPETLVYTVEVPEGTEDCYIAGQMNDWDFERMTQVDATHWTITYDNVLKTTEYKYACQASWDYVEKKDDGTDVANRTWTANDVVEKWNNPYTEVRTGLTAGNYYTICMTKEMKEVKGATLWSFYGKDANFAYLVQENAPYTAGKAYIMYAEAETVSAILTGEPAPAPVANGAIHGTFADMDQDDLTAAGDNIYLVIGNQLRRVDGQTGNSLPANRAYVDIDEIEVGAPAGIPANRVRSMPMQPQVATGMENVDASAQPVKTIINGQLYILRGEKMYDAQGKLVK